MQIVSKSLKETEDFAKKFLEEIFLRPKQKEALVVALQGNLGSGKTAFTKCVAKILGIKNEITSPTFVLMKSYKFQVSGFETLIHIDAYRLGKGEELSYLGWKEIIKNPQNLIFIEWPENVAEVMPKKHIKINFEFVDENTRKIEVVN